MNKESLSEKVLSNMTSEERFVLRHEIYTDVLYENTINDIKDFIDENDIELTTEEIEYAASLYVEDNEFDCNISYWQNIDNFVKKALLTREDDEEDEEEDKKEYMNNLLEFKDLIYNRNRSTIFDVNKITQFDDLRKKLKPKHLRNCLFFLLVPRDSESSLSILIGFVPKNKEKDVIYTDLQKINSVFETDEIKLFCEEMNERKRQDNLSVYKLILFKKVKKKDKKVKKLREIGVNAINGIN